MPGLTATNSYVPASPVVFDTEIPVSALVSVTLAPGTSAPDVSRTVPTTEALSNCANAELAPARSRARIRMERTQASRTVGIWPPRLSARRDGRAKQVQQLRNERLLHDAQEEQNQFEDQDQDDGDLQKLAARDGDLLDGEAVDVVERFQLVLDAVAPSRQAETHGGQREHARRVDVAHDLQRVVGAVGDLVDVDEERVHLVGGPHRTAPEQVLPPAGALQRRVDPRELRVQQRIVVAELEQLRVRELEELQRGGRARVRVVDERGVPRRDDEIVGQVRQPVLEYLVLLLRAQRRRLAAQHLRDLRAARGHQRLGVERRRELVHGEDQVVLGEERRPRLRHGAGAALDRLAHRLLGRFLEPRVLDIALAGREQIVPGAAERLHQRERDDAVVEELQARLEVVDVGETRRVPFEDEGRHLVREVPGLRGLRRQRRRRAGAQRLPQPGQIDLLGDVEEIQRRDGAGSNVHPVILEEDGGWRAEDGLRIKD